jgi:probable phosphomutase (TIGR03848 family)
VSTVVLVRHGLTKLTGPVLAGHTPGVHLDERGQAQASAVAARLAPVPLTAVVTSPLERCIETADVIRQAQVSAGRSPEWFVEDRIVECRYGDWTGRPLKELAKDPAWRLVQTQPSAARFPHGEALREVSARCVAAIRDWDSHFGPNATWLACSHGDVIKAIVADALGMHLDQFQRIVVDPGSVTLIRYTDARPYLLRCNDSVGDLAALAAPIRRRRSRRSADATPGGGTGSGQV